MNPTRWRAVLALMAALALTLGIAACGGDDDTQRRRAPKPPRPKAAKGAAARSSPTPKTAMSP